MASLSGLSKLNAALLESALIGSHRDVQRLLDEGADVYAVDRDGYTALSEAAAGGHTVVVGQLIRADSDPNQQAFDGRTSLHRSAFQGWQAVVRLLLESGADPEVADKQGKKPAELARSAAVRALIKDFPAEKTRELKREFPNRPSPPTAEASTPEVITSVATPQQPPRTRRFEVQTVPAEQVTPPAVEEVEPEVPKVVEVEEQEPEPLTGWNLELSEADAALATDPSNHKALFRRAKALFELGDLEEALADINKVVEHYERIQESANTEAADLKTQILEDLKRERAKFGQRGPARWNRGGGH
mmetsp:Transcript_21343/g.39045  ORF Transcript_21343/g.39045 Transcript_21343/m.39045 type:complete len:303 (-) Transcript_21343:53-961(-)